MKDCSQCLNWIPLEYIEDLEDTIGWCLEHKKYMEGCSFCDYPHFVNIHRFKKEKLREYKNIVVKN